MLDPIYLIGSVLAAFLVFLLVSTMLSAVYAMFAEGEVLRLQDILSLRRSSEFIGLLALYAMSAFSGGVLGTSVVFPASATGVSFVGLAYSAGLITCCARVLLVAFGRDLTGDLQLWHVGGFALVLFLAFYDVSLRGLFLNALASVGNEFVVLLGIGVVLFVFVGEMASTYVRE